MGRICCGGCEGFGVLGETGGSDGIFGEDGGVVAHVGGAGAGFGGVACAEGGEAFGFDFCGASAFALQGFGFGARDGVDAWAGGEEAVVGVEYPEAIGGVGVEDGEDFLAVGELMGVEAEGVAGDFACGEGEHSGAGGEFDAVVGGEDSGDGLGVEADEVASAWSPDFGGGEAAHGVGAWVVGVVVVPAFEVVFGSGVDAGVDFVGDGAELLDGEEGPAEHLGAFGWELGEGFEEGVVAAE